MTLIRKTFLTSLSKIINILSHFIFQFLMTPIILGFLGREIFGVFTLINKLEGYVSMADLRPTAILRYKLASLQASNNQKLKNEYISSSLLISLFFLPFIFLIGFLLSLGFSYFFIIDDKYVPIAQNCILILSAFVGVKGILGIPEAIIRGNNAEYKLFFTEPIRLIIYSFIVYFLLDNGYGLYGIIFSILLTGILDFFLKLFIQKIRFIKYKIVKPAKKRVKEFINKGSWFLVSSLSYQILSTFDVVIVGVTLGLEEVTIYALSKAMIFRFSESFSLISSSVSSSFGFLISVKNFKKLIFFRYLLFKIGLIVATLFLGYFFVFNSYFIALWVGQSNFIGEIENLIICTTIIFAVLSMNSTIFIDAFQIFKLKGKVLLTISIVFLLLAYFLSKYYGLLGVVLSVLICRFLIWFVYELILQQFIKVNFYTLFKQNYKTLLLLIIFFFFKYIYFNNIDVSNWFLLIIHSLGFLAVNLPFIYFFLLNREEKNHLFKILKNVSNFRLNSNAK